MQPLRRAPLLAIFWALPLLASVPASQGAGLSHVRLQPEGVSPDQVASLLEARGFDVMEGGTGPLGVELVTTEVEFELLAGEGWTLEVLAVGTPLRELAAADVGLAGYLETDAVVAAMQDVAAAYPAICRVVDLTATYGPSLTFEGRSLYAVVISDNVDVLEDEPAVLFTSTLHARELVTPVIALQALERLTQDYGSDPAITAAVDGNEIWFVPLCNPDGYQAVFDVDNLWRKNRRDFGGGDIGVDLNRNYPLGWDSLCSGDSSVASATYKGPAPGSEVESQTLIELCAERRFAKVIDFHSSGQEALWGYDCFDHPLDPFLQAEAIELSNAAGYGGDERRPSANGEFYHWHLSAYGSHAFLLETHTSFQPDYASAVVEAQQVFGGILWMLQRPIPLTGHVRDTCTSEPLAANLRFPGIVFEHDEMLTSGGTFGRYDAFLPVGNGVVELSSPGFVNAGSPISISAGGSFGLDASLSAIATLTPSGTAQPGTVFGIELAFPADAGLPYAGGMTLSGTTPGLPLNGCTLPANVDSIFVTSLVGNGPFADFAGTLDVAGAATATLAIPAVGSLVGLEADFAFLTLTPALVARHVSEALAFEILP